MTAQEEDGRSVGHPLPKVRHRAEDRRPARAPLFLLGEILKASLPKCRTMHPCGQGIAFALGDRSDPMQHEGREQHSRATRPI